MLFCNHRLLSSLHSLESAKYVVVHLGRRRILEFRNPLLIRVSYSKPGSNTFSRIPIRLSNRFNLRYHIIIDFPWRSLILIFRRDWQPFRQTNSLLLQLIWLIHITHAKNTLDLDLLIDEYRITEIDSCLDWSKLHLLFFTTRHHTTQSFATYIRSSSSGLFSLQAFIWNQVLYVTQIHIICLPVLWCIYWISLYFI